MLCSLTFSTDFGGTWIYHVWIYEEAMQRVCKEKKFNDDLRDPSYYVSGTWQHMVFEACDMNAHRVAKSEGYQGKWCVHYLGTRFLPEGTEIADPDYTYPGFSLKLVSRSE